MSVWFTADTHFGHTKVIEYMDRPWSTVEEMDDALIANWNAVVQPRDTVWHLGDFVFRGDARAYRHRLNGHIHLLMGNHDNKKNVEAAGFVSVRQVHYLRHEGHRFWLSHYAHRTWRNSYHGCFHLYGHSHGMISGYGKSMDVGVDAVAGYRPIHWEEIPLTLQNEIDTDHHPVSEGP